MLHRNTPTESVKKTYTAGDDTPFVLHTRIVNGVGGGPEKTILNSPQFLSTLGYRSACLYLYPGGDPGIDVLSKRAADSNAEMIAITDGAPLDFKIIRRLAELCRKRGVAIWHAHDYKTNLLGLLVRRHWPMKLVTTTHGWGAGNRSPKNLLYTAVGKGCLPFYDAVVSVSEDLYESARRWRVAPERVHLIHNAIDTQAYRRRLSRDAARRQLGGDDTGIIVAALGRLSAEKGFDILIDCIADLKSTDLPITLWIGGEGNYRDQLEKQVAMLGMQEHVHLIGHVSDPRLMIQAADIFALSSIREGLPNVVLEAMAMETPVVATRVAGVPRLIEDQKHGLLVNVGDKHQLSRAIARLAKDDELRKRLAGEARTRIELSYGFDRRMRKIAEVYERVLGGH